jgi:serine phosphatase RsbU (regulator of sigma subunit)
MIAPVLIKPDGCELLEVGGLPIGSMANITYRELATTINPGDTLLLVSDGVVEAHNPAGELFGFDRLEEAVLDAQPYGDVRALVELVLGRVQEFMGGAEQHDDITLVAVRPSFTFDDLILEQKEQAVAYAAL